MSTKRTIISRTPIPQLPGYESRLVLLQYKPGAAAPPHTHPVEGTNYVVSGAVESQWENGELERYETGEVFVDWAEKKHMLVRNPSDTEGLKVVVFYVIKADEPNVKML